MRLAIGTAADQRAITPADAEPEQFLRCAALSRRNSLMAKAGRVTARVLPFFGGLKRMALPVCSRLSTTCRDGAVEIDLVPPQGQYFAAPHPGCQGDHTRPIDAALGEARQQVRRLHRDKVAMVWCSTFGGFTRSAGL